MLGDPGAGATARAVVVWNAAALGSSSSSSARQFCSPGMGSGLASPPWIGWIGAGLGLAILLFAPRLTLVTASRLEEVPTRGSSPLLGGFPCGIREIAAPVSPPASIVATSSVGESGDTAPLRLSQQIG
jgi:hypothetical protein